MYKSRLRRVICLSGILVSTGPHWVRGQGEVSLHWPRSQKQPPGVELTLEEVARKPAITGIGFGPDTDVRPSSSGEGARQSQQVIQRVGSDGVFTAGAVHRGRRGAATFVAAGDSRKVTLQYDFGRQAKGPL
jgi:hypothetical protein